MKRFYDPDRSYLIKCSWLVVIVLLLGAGACSPARPATRQSKLSATPADASPTPTAVTPEPTATLAPNLVIMLVPDGADPEQALEIQNLLGELSAQDGLVFETRSDFSQIQFEPAARLVVVMGPDPGVANLANANPQIQFLAVGMEGLPEAPNLSTVGASAGRPDQLGFLAGYMAGVITKDWRVGVVAPAEGTAGKAAQNGFANGVIFFCGLCRPAYPPFVQYPFEINLPVEAGPAEQQAVADQLAANAVQTVFLAPGAEDHDLMQALAQKEIRMIGLERPADTFKPDWVASIRFDPSAAIRQIWPDVIAGQGGRNLSAALAITDVNPDLLSPGRQQLVEKMLSELAGGYIDSGVNPQSGEPIQ